MFIVRASIAVVLLVILSFASLMVWYVVTPYSNIYNRCASGSIALGSLITAVGQIKRNKWAWRAAVLFSALMLLAGLLVLWMAAHPRDEFARSEGGFAMSVVLVLCSPSALCLTLLNVPAVHRVFTAQHSAPELGIEN